MQYKLWFLFISSIAYISFADPIKDDAGTSKIDIIYIPRNFTLEDPRPSGEIIHRFEQELGRNYDVIIDKLGPPSYLTWMKKEQHPDYDYEREWSDVGKNVTIRFLGDSMAETAVALFPIEEWRYFGNQEWRNFWILMSGLVLGSIGNTVETRSSTSPEFSAADDSWWKRMKENGLRYGLRPWRKDPYIYAGSRIGHHGGSENLPVVIFEQRIGYRLFDAEILTTRLIFPLPHKFRIATSVSFDPLNLDGGDNRFRFTMKIERNFGRESSTKILYLGARNDGRNNWVVAGFLMPL